MQVEQQRLKLKNLIKRVMKLFKFPRLVQQIAIAMRNESTRKKDHARKLEEIVARCLDKKTMSPRTKHHFEVIAPSLSSLDTKERAQSGNTRNPFFFDQIDNMLSSFQTTDQ